MIEDSGILYIPAWYDSEQVVKAFRDGIMFTMKREKNGQITLHSGTGTLLDDL